MPKTYCAVRVNEDSDLALHRLGSRGEQDVQQPQSQIAGATVTGGSPAWKPATHTTRILVVEDEQDIAGLIKHALERDGDTIVDMVSSGDAALKAVVDQAPDLIILDLNLPVLNGFEVCRILRARPNTQQIPIIMLTARTNEVDRVSGLDLGADDYVTKPFSLRELAARVRAVLRRKQQAPVADALSVYRGRHLVADFEAVSIAVDGRAVRLTRREFELLKCLVENRNRVLSRDRLLERVWGYDRLIETRSVDVHIGRLRGKLGAAGDQIETVVGLGYRFIE
jgi:DNA-binding response OmpR family regulator